MSSDRPAREEKSELRRELRAARRALPAAELRARSQAMARAALASTLIRQARAVIGYAACEGELDVTPILDAARECGAEVFLPRVRAARELEVVPHDGAALAPSGPAGILEPIGAAAPLSELAIPAVVLAPCVALDAMGRRLGRGGGAYDRLLERARRLGWSVVGVCHASALRARVPTEPHDQSVDVLLTDAGLAPVDHGDRSV